MTPAISPLLPLVFAIGLKGTCYLFGGARGELVTVVFKSLGESKIRSNYLGARGKKVDQSLKIPTSSVRENPVRGCFPEEPERICELFFRGKGSSEKSSERLP